MHKHNLTISKSLLRTKTGKQNKQKKKNKKEKKKTRQNVHIHDEPEGERMMNVKEKMCWKIFQHRLLFNNF